MHQYHAHVYRNGRQQRLLVWGKDLVSLTRDARETRYTVCVDDGECAFPLYAAKTFKFYLNFGDAQRELDDYAAAHGWELVETELVTA
jgi:hypothetical protein